MLSYRSAHTVPGRPAQSAWRRRCVRTLSLLILLSLLLLPAADGYGQATDNGVGPTALDEALAGNPEECINPLKAAHITATIISLLPIPGFSDGGDVAEYLTNLALKLCSAVLDAPAAKVINPAEQSLLDSDPCTYYMRLPLTDEDMELIVLDRQMIQEIIAEISLDPTLRLSAAFLDYLEEYLASEFGRFESEKQGEYTNIYGIVFSSSSHGTDWGDLGSPEIYHYNSDVRIELFHPAERVDEDFIRFLPGDHALRWEGNTLISVFDFIPPIPGPFDNPVSEKVAKQTGEKSLREALRRAAREAIEQGSTEFAKKVAKETVKAFSEEVAKEIAKKTLQETVEGLLDSYFSLGKPHGVVQRDIQRVVILDGNAPIISGAQNITVEALEPGGASSGVHMATEQAKLTVTDDCDPEPTLRYATPAFWPLNIDADGNPLPAAEIVWTAEDNGAATANGGRNSSSVTSQVTVVDTKPPILVAPPPVVMEATGTVDVPLGIAQVFDVADLRPTITNDAPAQFTPGVYRIQWEATDASRNVSERTDDTEQIVNIKAPGTNVLPSAFDQTGANAVSAIADEPTRITVRGQDGNSPPDPLWFSIENQPENGFFIAPLYPYFIEDYRMAARYSPTIAGWVGEARALEIGSVPGAMNDFMKQLCSRTETPDPAIPVEPPDELPHDFVSWSGGSEKYMAVDDDGFTYIYDSRYTDCDQNHQPRTTERVSVWDAEGLFVGEFFVGDRQVKGINFDLVRGYILITSVSGTISSASAHTHVQVLQINKGNSEQPLEELRWYRMRNDIIAIRDDGTERNAQMRAESAVLDSNGVLYAIGRQPWEGMIAAYPNLAPATNEDEMIMMEPLIWSLSIRQSVPDDRGMRLRFLHDIALDSQNNIYVAATWTTEDGAPSNTDRIYKFSAATPNPDGTATIGEFVGWMGKCTSGPHCDYINQRSIGYSCSDETCFLDAGESGTGGRQGQFARLNSIAIDPNDVLYATDAPDSENRVQRFSPEGYVAGEARATGNGDGFVLGDFRTVTHMAVNKSSFYILDGSREIVHVFDAAVIHGIDDTSAWVEYQSDSNYRGLDRFTFSATDGFRTGEGELLSSPPATVEINVARNFRPPDAAPDLAAALNEDTPTPITLRGSDLDGDNLTFEVTTPPIHGEISGTPPTVTYTPNPHYFGEDSFEFVAVDDSGHPDNRSQPEPFRLVIASQNDTPMISFATDQLRTGVGYPLTLEADFFDPDPEEQHSVTVNWGDGTVERDGQVESDGTVAGPVIVEDEDENRQVVAYHTYAQGGQYTVEVCVTDAADSTGCGQIRAVVEPMADLAIERAGPYFVGAGATGVDYVLTAVNQPPERGGGIGASNVVISETLQEGLRYATPLPAGCTVDGVTLRCTIGALAPGQMADVALRAEFTTVAAARGLAITAAGDSFTAEASVSQSGPDPIEENNRLRYDITVVRAADFIVDSYDDDGDAEPGDGRCRTFAEVCTLRAAVQEANALAGEQSIALAYGVYLLNPPPTGNTSAVEPQPEDQALTGDLDILDDVMILGLSADNSIVHANGEDRVFELHPGASLWLEDLMLTGGRPLYFGEGGALYSHGNEATLVRTSIMGNASPGDGGGILHTAGSLLIDAGTVMGNTAAGMGGGIHNAAAMELRNVTLSGNRAQTGGALAGSQGVARLENVTISNNAASGAGGGISGPGETIVAVNTIFQNNAAPIGSTCSSAFRSEGYNLIDELADCSVLGETGSNIVGAGVDLTALELNAANTFSQTPKEEGRAIDRGSCRLATDQRGVERPYGDGCDIGAVEFGPDDVVAPFIYRLNLPIIFR